METKQVSQLCTSTIEYNSNTFGNIFRHIEIGLANLHVIDEGLGLNKVMERVLLLISMPIVPSTIIYSDKRDRFLIVNILIQLT